jgi:hypothetical protein
MLSSNPCIAAIYPFEWCLSVVVRRELGRRARQAWHHDMSTNRTANAVVQQDVPGWYAGGQCAIGAVSCEGTGVRLLY